jgi:hypothetical protein
LLVVHRLPSPTPFPSASWTSHTLEFVSFELRCRTESVNNEHIMSLSIPPSLQVEDRLFDEVSLPSCQPSDEEGKKFEKGRLNGQKESFLGYEEPTDKRISDEKSFCSRPDQKSYLSNSSFTEYLSHIIPTGFVNGWSTGIDPRPDSRADESSAASKIMERSSHSRYYIENTESIRDRRDERRERRNFVAEDAREDSGAYSIEEYTEMSEITLDVPTVIAESKFVACSGLPTIEEAKRFNPAVAACTVNYSRRNNRAQCGATGETSKNGTVIDLVFELVEDAFCVPLNRSKAEKKKAFLEAYHEESIKLARNNTVVDAWQTSSRHSRSSRTPRRSGKSPDYVPSTSNERMSLDTPGIPAVQQISKKTKNDSCSMIVDKAPPPRPHFLQKMAYGMDEEQTLDWSKIMSFAEKQLEADGKSVVSRATDFSSFHTRNSDRTSFAENEGKGSAAMAPEIAPSVMATTSSVQEHDKSTTSSLSNSSSTHATAVESVTSNNETVQDMRDVSAMDSCSFEEEPRRLLLTSLLFGLFVQFIQGRNNPGQEDHIQQSNIKKLGYANQPLEERTQESFLHKFVHYSAFFLCFIFWPAGIPRTMIEFKPIPRKLEKPSLLKLVFKPEVES